MLKLALYHHCDFFTSARLGFLNLIVGIIMTIVNSHFTKLQTIRFEKPT